MDQSVHTYKHIAVVNGVSKEVEVNERGNGMGSYGFHYNYRFEVKVMKTNWRGYLYRPGESFSFHTLMYKEGDIISQLVEKIEDDFHKKIKKNREGGYPSYTYT